MALIKCSDCGADVSDAAPSCPRCGRPAPVGPAPAGIPPRPMPPAPAPPASVSAGVKIFAGLVVAAVLGTILLILEHRPPPPYTPPASSGALTHPEPAPSPLPPPEPTPAEKIAAAATLDAALALTLPLMDDTFNEVSVGAGLFALWAVQKPQAFLADWQKRPETKRGLVMKDPAAERGKRLCARGRISEIHAERTAVGTVYNGGLVSGYSDVTRFIAVGDTGDLVEGRSARFCGIVTGTYSYSNAGGGTTHAPLIVGGFESEQYEE